MNRKMLNALKILCLLLVSASVYAADDAVLLTSQLDQDLQGLKEEVLQLSTELSRIEKQLLFPSDTHINIFLSIAKKSDITLDSARLEIDSQLVTSHLYTKSELNALFKGGVQKLYTGNVVTGEHTLSLNITGSTGSGDEINFTQTYQIEKTESAGFLEAHISVPNAATALISFKDQ